MARKIQFRRGIAATWTSTNPTLAIGEFGLETDTGRGKVGTGVTAWVSLPYLDAGAVAHIADTVAAHTAGAIAFTPAGTIAATDLQAAVVEVATDAAAATATVAGDLSTLSSATSDALALKAALASPALTGTPTAPTAVTATSTTQLATTAFVQQERAAQAATDSSRILSLGGPGSTATGNRVVFLGDSITRGGQSTSEAALDDVRWRSAAIPAWASILSKQRIMEVRMAGVGGDAVADMLARFDTDVTPYSPNVVVIMGGTNDTNSLYLTAIADYATTIAAIVDKCYLIGAKPVLCTIAPHSTDGAVADRKTRIATINHWLRRWAPANGITLIDMNHLWSDRTTDDFSSTYLNDGTHPNELGYYDAGQKLATELAPLLPPNYPPYSASNVDPLNKIANGQFLGSLTSGVPASWTGPVQSGVTGSQVTGDTTINGNWYKATSAGHGTTNTLSQTVSGIVGGHTYAFSGRLKTDFATGNLLLRLRFNSSSSTGYEWRPVSLLTKDIADGAFYLECLAPSDATTALIESRYAADSGGYVQLGNLTLIDLDGLPAI